MKHHWVMSWRGKVTKYYHCKQCGFQMVASSKIIADLMAPPCKRDEK